ncbi:MAG: DUF2497 domain-containing protein [Pseudomonadota bacterium]
MAEQAPEPTMEEILSSIRDAINDDKPSSEASPLNGDPFGSSPAAGPDPAVPQANASGSQDPFAELSRRLHETRESVHKQMQEASTPSGLTAPQTQSSAAPPAAPSLEAAAAQATPASGLDTRIAEAASAEDHRNEFSQIVANLSRRAPEPAESAVAPPAPPAAAPAPGPAMARSAVSTPSPSLSGELDERTLMEAVLRKIIEPAVKSWLDENLTRLVTETVRDELRKSGTTLK